MKISSSLFNRIVLISFYFFIFLSVYLVIFSLVGFSFISTSVTNYINNIYLILHITAVVWIYTHRRETQSTFVLIFMLIVVCVNQDFRHPIFFIFTMYLFYFKCTKLWQKIIFLIPIVAILFFPIFLLFLFIGKNYVSNQFFSPDSKHLIEIYNADEGALGGTSFAKLYTTYFGVIKEYKGTMYIHTWNPSMKVVWIDTETVKIENSFVNINQYQTLYDEGFGNVRPSKPWK